MRAMTGHGRPPVGRDRHGGAIALLTAATSPSSELTCSANTSAIDGDITDGSSCDGRDVTGDKLADTFRHIRDWSEGRSGECNKFSLVH